MGQKTLHAFSPDLATSQAIEFPVNFFSFVPTQIRLMLILCSTIVLVKLGGPWRVFQWGASKKRGISESVSH